jgi:AraC-like DNA-binding protein
VELAYDGSAIVRLGAAHVGVRVDGYRACFLGWGFCAPRPWRNYPHAHSFYEVCYAYSGRGHFRRGDTRHNVAHGALFVARPGEVHEIVSSEDDPLGIQFWQFTLVREVEGGASRDAAGSRARELIEAFAATNPPVVPVAADRLGAVLELLTREAAAPGAGHIEVVQALATTLLLDTARAVVDDPALAPDPEAGSRGRDELTVQAMVRYLRDNYSWAVRTRDVAAQVHLSERHTNRLFRRYTGTTIHAYLTGYRLDVAARTLTAERSSIKEVAHHCGYPDVRAFTTAFRRHWGATPAAFRAAKGTAHLAAGQHAPGLASPISRWTTTV